MAWLAELSDDVQRRVVQADPCVPDVAIDFVRQGGIVYKHRDRRVLVIAAVFCVLGMARAPSFCFLAVATLLCYLSIDFFGGVLHIVLDHEPFTKLPIM